VTRLCNVDASGVHDIFLNPGSGERNPIHPGRKYYSGIELFKKICTTMIKNLHKMFKTGNSALKNVLK
jgi:hypothetical protein